MLKKKETLFPKAQKCLFLSPTNSPRPKEIVFTLEKDKEGKQRKKLLSVCQLLYDTLLRCAAHCRQHQLYIYFVKVTFLM